MDKEVRISVTPGTVVITLVILAGAYLAWFLRDLILLVLTAIVLASAIRPGVLLFMRTGLPRLLAVLAMYLVVFGAVFGLVYFFFPPIIAEATNFIQTLPRVLDTINLPFTTTSTADFFSGSNSALSSLSSIQDAFTNTSQGAFRLVATFFGGIFSFVLVVVLSFYFAVQEQGIEDFLRVIVPLSYEEYIISLWHRAQHKIGLWMQGQLMLSLLAGVLVYLGLLIVGAPFALLLGVLTALCEVIPIFGSLFAGSIAVAIAWSGSGAALAFIVAGLFVVVNQFESNLIYPLVVKKIVGVPPLLVIVGLIAGVDIAGFLGAFLSVPVAAILQELVNDLDRGRRMRAANGTV
jgi:predicted PurR-regulated permease PerM